MENMINNLINGKLKDAKRQAKMYSVKEMKSYMMDDLGWDSLKAFRACNYLKNPSELTFSRWYTSAFSTKS